MSSSSIHMPNFDKVREKFLSRSLSLPNEAKDDDNDENDGDDGEETKDTNTDGVKLIDDLYMMIKHKRSRKKKNKTTSILSPINTSSSSSFDVSSLMSSKVKLISELSKSDDTSTTSSMMIAWDDCEAALSSALEGRGSSSNSSSSSNRDMKDILRSALSYMLVMSNIIREGTNNDNDDDNDALNEVRGTLQSCIDLNDTISGDDYGCSLSMKMHALIMTNILLALSISIKKEKEKLAEYKSIMIAKDILDRRQLAHLSSEIDRLHEKHGELVEHNDYLTVVNDRMRQQQIEDFEMIQQRLTKTMSDERDQSLHDTVEHLSKYTVQDMIDSKYNDDELQSMEYELRVVLKRVTRARDEIEKRKIENTDSNNSCCVCLEGKKTVVLMPCRHLCLCDACQYRIKETCPLCKTTVTHSINVYS